MDSSCATCSGRGWILQQVEISQKTKQETWKYAPCSDCSYEMAGALMEVTFPKIRTGEALCPLTGINYSGRLTLDSIVKDAEIDDMPTAIFSVIEEPQAVTLEPVRQWRCKMLEPVLYDAGYKPYKSGEYIYLLAIDFYDDDPFADENPVNGKPPIRRGYLASYKEIKDMPNEDYRKDTVLVCPETNSMKLPPNRFILWSDVLKLEVVQIQTNTKYFKPGFICFSNTKEYYEGWIDKASARGLAQFKSQKQPDVGQPENVKQRETGRETRETAMPDVSYEPITPEMVASWEEPVPLPDKPGYRGFADLISGTNEELNKKIEALDMKMEVVAINADNNWELRKSFEEQDYDDSDPFADEILDEEYYEDVSSYEGYDPDYDPYAATSEDAATSEE